jgi:uncharacterized protein with PQ loop repeat
MPEDIGYNIGYVVGTVGSFVFLIRMIVDAFKYVHQKRIQWRKIVYIVFCCLWGIWCISGLLSAMLMQ